MKGGDRHQKVKKLRILANTEKNRVKYVSYVQEDKDDDDDDE